jgi:hypothetical protein
MIVVSDEGAAVVDADGVVDDAHTQDVDGDILLVGILPLDCNECIVLDNVAESGDRCSSSSPKQGSGMSMSEVRTSGRAELGRSGTSDSLRETVPCDELRTRSSGLDKVATRCTTGDEYDSVRFGAMLVVTPPIVLLLLVPVACVGVEVGGSAAWYDGGRASKCANCS